VIFHGFPLKDVRPDLVKATVRCKRCAHPIPVTFPGPYDCQCQPLIFGSTCPDGCVMPGNEEYVILTETTILATDKRKMRNWFVEMYPGHLRLVKKLRKRVPGLTRSEANLYLWGLKNGPAGVVRVVKEQVDADA
jgi:hypothetical protein